MQVLAKENKTEHVVIEPAITSGQSSTTLTLTWYDMKPIELIREEKYKGYSVFLVKLGHCTYSVRVRLENDTRFTKMKENNNVLGLLKRLRYFTYITDGSQPHTSLCQTTNRFSSITQDNKVRIQYMCVVVVFYCTL